MLDFGDSPPYNSRLNFDDQVAGGLNDKFMKFVTSSKKEILLNVVEDHKATAGPAADMIEGLVNKQKDRLITICFSTGSSPLPLYRELVKRHQKQDISFSNVRAFLLDEYIGLPAGHPACFRTFMEEHLYKDIDLNPKNMNFYFGPVEDHMQNCYRYDRALNETGGVDVMILGIGRNGHIAFNEPGTLPETRTRMIKLTESTRQVNARFFSSIQEVPTHALSVGIANILESKNLLLIAAGESKADAIRKSLLGPVDNNVPASHLQNYKGNLTIVLDKEAASGLNLES